jgi:hypothetical protein
MTTDPEPATPPAAGSPIAVRQGVISGRVLTVLVVSIVLAVIGFVIASYLA